MMKENITNQHEEFKNSKGLTVIYDEMTGNISVESENEIIFSVYDGGNWENIKSHIVEVISKADYILTEQFKIQLLDCKQDILQYEGGISIQYEARNLDSFLGKMSVKHGFDNVAVLITNHIRIQMWDGRYSPEVKNWAKNQPDLRVPIYDNSMIPKVNYNDYTLGNTHPVIVNFACQWVIENEKNKDNFKSKIEEDKPSPFSQLYDKMCSEQEQYKAWLIEQPPEEILKHSYEYAMREDILSFMNDSGLSEEHAKVLLKSDTPLADIYKDLSKRDYSFKEEFFETITDKANGTINKSDDITQDTIDIKG